MVYSIAACATRMSHAAGYARHISACRRARRGRGSDCNRGGGGGDRFRRHRHQCGHLQGPIGERAERRGPVVADRPIGTASNWHFVSSATDVAGQVGTQFGIEFRIDGNPVGDGVTLHMVLKFPPQGIRNPNTGDTLHTVDMPFPNLKIGALCLLGYGFDNAWEIVPGVWTEQIWYRDRNLAERTFTVSGPEHGDHLRRLRHRSNNLSAAFLRRLKALTHVQTLHRQTSPF
jgi:Domain of unknown function (DUF3859)